MPLKLATLIVAAATAVFQGPAMGQARGRGSVPHASAALPRLPLTGRDSIRALKAVRNAQNKFEGLRRQLLPYQARMAGATGGHCDVVIGRYCFSQQMGEGPPPEAPKVIAGRERLLVMLDSVDALMPGNRWILAQRFRYLVEAGRAPEADSMAVACAASAPPGETRRWCHALAGYAAQERGDYSAAESAFASALAEMRDPERCAWLGLALPLDGAAQRAFEHLSCSARDSVAAAVWRLVQPLYLTGANDLRTEYLARVTRMYIEENTRTPMASSWGTDYAESLLRFGGGMWYTQDRSGGAVASHRRGPAFNFFPETHALISPARLKLDDWSLYSLTAYTRYAPEYARIFEQLLDKQVAVFRRGDSALVVAAFDVTNDASFDGGPLRAGVFAAELANGGVRPPHGAAIENAGPSVIGTARVAWAPLVVSLEVMNPANQAAARARYTLKLPTSGARLSISDLLLYTPRDSAPARLEDAMPRALHTSKVPRNRRLGLYWETYANHQSAEPCDFALIVKPVGESWMHKAFVKLGVYEKTRALSVAWRETPALADGIAPRALDVDLTLLKPGRYRVSLSVTPTGAQPVVAEREIEVEK